MKEFKVFVSYECGKFITVIAENEESALQSVQENIDCLKDDVKEIQDIIRLNEYIEDTLYIHDDVEHMKARNKKFCIKKINGVDI